MKLLGKRTSKAKATEDVVPTDMPKTGVVTSVGLEESRKYHFKLPSLGAKKKVLLPVVIAAVVICLGVYLTVSFLHKRAENNTIKIGNTKITKNDINTFADGFTDYKKENPAIILPDNLKQFALDALVLNAALKADAQKFGVTVSDAELLDKLIKTVADGRYNTLADYRKTPQGKMLLIQNENVLLKAKLEDKLLAKKNLFGVLLTYDTVYFNTMPKDKAEAAQKKAQEDMKAKFMPAFQQKKSKEEIAKLTDVNNLNKENIDDAKYADLGKRSYTIAEYYADYRNDGTVFNDIPDTEKILGREIGDMVDTDQKVSELKKAGDYTNVFASENGAYMILRLESKTDGAYNSWEEYLDHYKNASVAKKLTFSWLMSRSTAILEAQNKARIKAASEALAQVTSLGVEHAYAVTCTGHQITWSYSATDQASGASISGAKVSGYRRAHDCPDGIVGTKILTSPQTVGDNCNGPAIAWSHDTTPPGYIFVSISQDGWPGANSRQDLKIREVYKRDTPPPPPPANIQAHVFSVKTNNTGSYTNLSNMTVTTCGNPTLTTDNNGYARMTINTGTAYCIRSSGYVPSAAYQTVNGPYVRPYGESYAASGTTCGPYGSAPYTSNCTIPSYECQVAGTSAGSTCGGAVRDRASDTGFDLVYEIDPAPAPSCSISASPNPMNEGENTTIRWSSSYGASMTIKKNGVAWDSGTSGSRSDNPTSTVTYSAHVTNADGAADCSTVVTVIPLPDCTISASPSSYVGGGSNSTTIRWDSTNATAVNITRGGTNFASGVRGSQSDNQQDANTYTYTCTATIAGAHGVTLSRSRSVNLTVYPPPGCSASPASPPYYYAPNDTVTYVASGGDPANTYTWSSGTTGPTYSTVYGSAAIYTVSVTNGGVTKSCQAYVVNKPFHRVFGGDTLAGVGFAAPDTSCPAASIVGNKRQLGFTRNIGGNYTGGGNSHANVATGSIFEFVSGMLEPGPSNPRVFAFANNGGGYGGNFNTANLASACATNYYSKMVPGLPTPPANVSGLADGSYSYNGNLSLGGGTVPSGVHAIIYVNGNVFISSNIAFAGSGAYGTDPTNIPSLRIVAQGNIYVGSGVSELNGVYIAQPNGASGGSFYTCGFDRGGGTFNGPSVSSGDGSSGNPYISSEYISQCASQPLSVYGAVIARDIKLFRSQGTLPGGTEGYPSSAAERFIYTPDTWFNGDPSTSKPFQSYTALPSIF